MSTSVIASLITTQTTFRKVAPRAIRIPTSFVLCATIRRKPVESNRSQEQRENAEKTGDLGDDALHQEGSVDEFAQRLDILRKAWINRCNQLVKHRHCCLRISCNENLEDSEVV